MIKMMTAMYTMKRGGAYDRFVMMVEAFLERGWEVHCLSLTPIQVKNPCFHNHILFYPFRSKENSMAKLAVLFFFPLWSLWIGWRHKIDLIIAFGSLYAFLLGFSKRLLRRPLITFIRGNYSFGLRMQNSCNLLLLVNKVIEHYGFLFSNKIVANNSALRDEIFKKLRRGRGIDVQVLYNNIPPMAIREKQDPIRTRDKYGIPEIAKVLVTAGVLNRGKNIEAIIDCLPRIQIENLYFLVLGDASTEADFRYRGSLQTLVRELRLEKKVIFAGWLDKLDLWKIYGASDLFVLSSLNEGMPNALLEALGSDLPCLGSNIPGIRDALYYDKLVFDPLDVVSLSQRIQKVLNDSNEFDLVRKLCQRRKIEFTFDWQEKFYELGYALLHEAYSGKTQT